MTTKLIAADASAGAILDPSVGDGTLVIQTGAAGAKVDAISIAANGKVALNGQTVSASVANTVTNKIAFVINGVTYYLLASTSGA